MKKSLQLILISVLFSGLVMAGEKVKPLENYGADSEMKHPEAAVIIMTAGDPLLLKMQIDPEGRWFEMKGQRNEPVMFPVKVGLPVIIDEIYTDFTRDESNLFYSATKRLMIKNTDKKNNLTNIPEPGLYYLGAFVFPHNNTVVDASQPYVVLQLAQKKYPQYFATMKHVNFNIEKEKADYEKYLELKNKIREEERIRRQKEIESAPGLPVPQPIGK